MRAGRDLRLAGALVGAALAVASPASAATHRGFADVFSFATYLARFENLIFYLQAKGGYELDAGVIVRLYGSLRAARDTRSTGGQVPVIFSDNFAVLAGGVSLSPFVRNVVFFAEVGGAFALMDVGPNADSVRFDGRAGVAVWWPFGYARPEGRCPSWCAPLKPFAEIYSDLVYFSRFSHNLIWYFNPRGGVSLAQYQDAFLVQLYARVNLLVDSNHDFYNNVFEPSVGVRLLPFKTVDLHLLFEYFYGVYLGLERAAEPNPYGPRFHDFRVTLIYGGYW
jgi:hypothetical protein